MMLLTTELMYQKNLLNMKTIEKELIKFYLDWVNNFLTFSAMADHYGLPYKVVEECIHIGMELHERNVERIRKTEANAQ